MRILKIKSLLNLDQPSRLDLVEFFNTSIISISQFQFQFKLRGPIKINL